MSKNKIKTANRGAAIAKNTQRYKQLEHKVKALEKEDRALRKALALEAGRRKVLEAETSARLEHLERPLRRKVADYFVGLYSKVRAKLKREPGPSDAAEQPPELEIVEPPPHDMTKVTKAALEAKSKSDAKRRAAELTSSPAGGMATASLELEKAEAEAEEGKNDER